MGISYVAMLTAFYVDNGPHLPLWDRLPTLTFWLLPSAVGAPVIARALTCARHAHTGHVSRTRPPCHPAGLLPSLEHRFYPAWMTSPDPDRLRYAQIAGTAARHAQAWLTAEQEAAAVAELTEAAAGRADLLAECAGTALGFGEGGQDAARYRQIAELCIAAGANQTLIERWIAVGRERAATARARPYAGPPTRE